MNRLMWVIGLVFTGVLSATDPVEWPKSSVLLLKLRNNDEIKICVIPCSYFKHASTVTIGSNHCAHPYETWIKAQQLLRHYPRATNIEADVQQNGQGQVAHICCVSILHGTCSHQSMINLEHPIQFHDAIMLDEELAQALQLEPLDEQELLEYTETQSEMERFSKFDDPVPCQLTIPSEPPSRFTILMRQVGISLLLSYLKARSYVSNGWRSVKSALGYKHETCR